METSNRIGKKKCFPFSLVKYNVEQTHNIKKKTNHITVFIDTILYTFQYTIVNENLYIPLCMMYTRLSKGNWSNILYP